MNDFKFDYYQYKQRINPQQKLRISLCLVLIIILIGVVCLINQNTNTIEFHFVEIGTFLNYKEANTKALELQQRNAGGYIYFDGTYHVLACAYTNKEDAKAVATNISSDFPSAKYFCLTTKKYNLKSYNKTERTTIEKVITTNEKTISSLYNLMIEFEKNEISERQLTLKINQLNSSYVENTAEFMSIFKVNSQISTLKEKISTIQSCLTESLEGYKLKYNLIKITISHYSFLEFFC